MPGKLSISRQTCWQVDGRLLPGRRPQGLTSLEFAIVLAIIATLAYFLLQGLLFVKGEGERQAFEDNRAAIERAVSYELMSRGTRGEESVAASLALQDPFQWLQPKPLGWAGVYPAGKPLKPGAWYWDETRHEVVYVPREPAHVRFTGKAQREIRLRLELTGSGQAHLVAVWPFTWQAG